VRVTYTLADTGALEALHAENARLNEVLGRMEHFRSSAETALAMAEERERTAVVAYLRTLDERWGLGASVCGAAADEIERGLHRTDETSGRV